MPCSNIQDLYLSPQSMLWNQAVGFPPSLFYPSHPPPPHLPKSNPIVALLLRTALHRNSTSSALQILSLCSWSCTDLERESSLTLLPFFLCSRGPTKPASARATLQGPWRSSASSAIWYPCRVRPLALLSSPAAFGGERRSFPFPSNLPLPELVTSRGFYKHVYLWIKWTESLSSRELCLPRMDRQAFTLSGGKPSQSLRSWAWSLSKRDPPDFKEKMLLVFRPSQRLLAGSKRCPGALRASFTCSGCHLQ